MFDMSSAKGYNSLPNDKILDSSTLREFAENNSKLDKNGGEFPKWVENNAGKRRNCLLQAISPFPTLFSKDWYCRYIKTRAYLGKG